MPYFIGPRAHFAHFSPPHFIKCGGIYYSLFMDCESLIGLILLGMVMFRPTFHEKWDEILRTKSAADKEQFYTGITGQLRRDWRAMTA